MPIDYSTLHIHWTKPPSNDCVNLRLVRSTHNLSQSGGQPPGTTTDSAAQADGLVLFTDVVDRIPSFNDSHLPSGFIYYTMWGWSNTSQIWIRCSDVIGLVPINWGYGYRLYSLLPAAYRDRDIVLVDPYNPWALPQGSYQHYTVQTGDTWASLALSYGTTGDSLATLNGEDTSTDLAPGQTILVPTPGSDAPIPPLQRYLQLIGFQFDFLRTELESLMSVNDPQNCSGAVLPLLAQQLAIVHEPEIGMQQERQLLSNAIHLYKIKGSPRGIMEFCSIMTSYPATSLVHHGYNLMLTQDDSVGVDNTGTWQPWPPADTNFPPLAASNQGLTIDFNPNLLSGPDAIPGMTDPVGEIYGTNFPGLQPPYNDSGLDVQAAGTNALTAENSSFEGGTVGTWVAGANTNIANSTAQAAAGIHSLAVTSTRQTNNATASVTSATGSLSAYPSTPFLASASVRSGGQNRQAYISIQWFNAANASLGTVTGTQDTEVTGDWADVTVTGTSPAGVDHATLTVTFVGAGNNEVHYLDNVWFGRGGQDIVLTTGPIPITDFISQYYAQGTVTFRIQIWSSVARQVALSVWGDVGSGTPVQIIAPQTFTETAGHWVQMTVTGPFNPYPQSVVGSPTPSGPASYYWIYPRVRIITAGAESHYLTLMGVWPCTPAKIGVDTPVYDYPRDVKVVLQPQYSNLLSNSLTTFSRINPNPPPAQLLIGFDGLCAATDPVAKADSTGTMTYRQQTLEDAPGAIAVHGNAALQFTVTGPNGTVWFGKVTNWSAAPPSPNGWFDSSAAHNWFPGAVPGSAASRPWMDPMGSNPTNPPNSWFVEPVPGSTPPFGDYFGIGQSIVNGIWFPASPQPTANCNINAFNVQSGQPFNFSIYAEYTSIQDPTNARMVMGFRWYYADGTWVETTTNYTLTTTYERYSIAPGGGPFSLGEPPPQVNPPSGQLPTTMYPFVRFPNAQQASFLLNGAMLAPSVTEPAYMDATSFSSATGDFLQDPNGASYFYAQRTPRIARLTSELYRWLPMGSTYSIVYTSGATMPPLDPTRW